MDRNIRAMNVQLTPTNIHLDLSKAFDSIDHIILSSILKYYGVEGVSFNLLKKICISTKPIMLILIAQNLISM